MLPNAAIVLVRPGPFAGTRTVPAETAAEQAVTAGSLPLPAPRAPWARGHRSFRGTRITTGLMLGWAGLLLIGVGAFAVPAASALGTVADAGLLRLLGVVAPLLAVAGALHLAAAVGIWRDQSWGYRLAVWMLATGVFAVLGGFVLTVAGRSPFGITVAGGGSIAEGLALSTWTLAIYALAGWGIRRIVAARGTI